MEEQILADIAKGIKENLDIAAQGDVGYKINILNKMGYDLKQIEEEISKATDLSIKETEDLLKKSSHLSYKNDKKLYKAGGKILPDMTPKMNDFILGAITNNSKELKNITNTLGFVTSSGYKDLTSFYRDTMDYATFQLGSGAYSYDEVINQAVRQLSDSGVRYIDYDSGISNHVDVAVRRAILTTNAQITGYMSEQNADMMGQDLMEITSHLGSRPSHAEWQGQVVSRKGNPKFLSLEDIGYGDVRGFKGANCRHDWFPWFEGISKSSAREKEPPPFEYNGRKYNSYEASQYQRAIERRMRKSKRELIVYDNAKLRKDYTSSMIKLNRQEDLYKDFSREAGIRPKWERTFVYK